MPKKPLTLVLYDYLERYKERWISKKELEVQAHRHHYQGDSACRILRSMSEHNRIYKDYEYNGGKRFVKYKFNDTA